MQYTSQFIKPLTKSTLRRMEPLRPTMDAMTLRQMQWSEALHETRFPTVKHTYKNAKPDPIDIYNTLDDFDEDSVRYRPKTKGNTNGQ